MVLLDKKYQQCADIRTSGEVLALVSELTDYMATHEDQQEARMEQVRGEELSSLWGGVWRFYVPNLKFVLKGLISETFFACTQFSMFELMDGEIIVK